MIFNVRYFHINDLVEHYAKDLSDDLVLSFLSKGVKTEEEAEHLSLFIWKMIDQMVKDREDKKIVLGSFNNSSMLPDLSYEMDAYMEKAGYSDIWEKISEEA